MSESSIFTRRRMGLDRNVWVIMVFSCLVCVGLLGYKMIAEEPCGVVKLIVKSDLGAYRDFHPNDPLRFTVFMEGSKKVTWDFGDKSTQDESGASVSHVFTTAGEYVVTAKVNGKCDEAIAVNIIRNKPIEDTTSFYVQNVITSSNRFPQVGEKVSFTSSIDAKLYEWSIEGGTQPAKKDKMATYTFDQPQSYIIKLKLDNDPKKTYSIPIMVAPVAKPNQPQQTASVPRILVPQNYPYIPPPDNTTSNPQPAAPHNDPKPPETKPAEVVKRPDPVPAEATTSTQQPPRIYYFKNTEQFKAMLEEVIASDKNAKDFDKYLCDGGNTLVIENGSQTTFAGLCKNLQGEKRKIVMVEFLDITTFPDKSRCVKELKVKHEKKKTGLFN